MRAKDCKKCKKALEDCGCEGLQKGSRMKTVPCTVVQTIRPFKIEDGKRFNVPATIHADCPRCEKAVKFQLVGDHYLSYPVANKPFNHLVSHYSEKDQDFHEFYVKVQLRVHLVAAK